jgi:hypothetical protein
MDENEANAIFGAANIDKLTKFKMDGGKVDFGDQVHLAGSPQGTAIVVWSIDGRVAVKGVLFSDNFRSPQTATVEIRFKRSDGHIPTPTTRNKTTQGAPVGFKTVYKASPAGRYNEVRVRLSNTQNTALGTTTNVLKTRTFRR